MLTFSQKIERRLKRSLAKVNARVLAVEHRCAKMRHAMNARGQILFEKVYASTPSGKTLCIFAHFDQGGQVDAYVLHYLTQLKAQGCAIVLVTTSPKDAFLRHLPTVEPRLSALVDRVIIRKNLSLDFGSYYIGLKSVNLADYDRLIFCNDSVYGPFTDLATDFARAEHYDVWGYTDSLEFNYHIQSYFIAIHLTPLALQALQAWQDKFLYHRFKGNVIRHGELALTKYFTALGLNCGVLYPYAELIDGVMTSHQTVLAKEGSGEALTASERYVKEYFSVLTSKCNTSHAYWFLLTNDYRFPFIKRELIDLNPLDTAAINNWQAIVAKAFAIDTTMYANHQKRLR